MFDSIGTRHSLLCAISTWRGLPALPPDLTNTKRLTRIPLWINGDAGIDPAHQLLSEPKWMWLLGLGWSGCVSGTCHCGTHPCVPIQIMGTVRRREVGGDGGDKESSLVSFILSHLDQLMCEDSHCPVNFRQTRFHLSCGFLSFTLKQFAVFIEAGDVCVAGRWLISLLLEKSPAKQECIVHNLPWCLCRLAHRSLPSSLPYSLCIIQRSRAGGITIHTECTWSIPTAMMTRTWMRSSPTRPW